MDAFLCILNRYNIDFLLDSLSGLVEENINQTITSYLFSSFWTQLLEVAYKFWNIGPCVLFFQVKNVNYKTFVHKMNYKASVSLDSTIFFNIKQK